VQPDLKKLVAYSSVSHLGFVMLGLFTLTPQGMVGAVIQMVNHGLSTGALFLMVGMIYERRHTRLISEFGGLWGVIPAFSALFLIVCLSSLGLPGLNGFVGEFLILLGAFTVDKWLAAAASTGIILAAVYLLWMYQRVAFGELRNEANRRLADLTPREWAVLVPVLALVVWIGVYPKAFTAKTEVSVQALIAQVESKASVALRKTAPRVVERSQEPFGLTAERSREPSRTGHPRFEPASRLSLQRNREPSRTGHPRNELGSRTPLQ
jgi:NADH-quinone oxidoreductase subunit M